MKRIQDFIVDLKEKKINGYENFFKKTIAIPSVFKLSSDQKLYLVISYESLPYDGCLHPKDLCVGLFDMVTGDLIKQIELDDDFEGNVGMYTKYENYLMDVPVCEEERIAYVINQVIEGFVQGSSVSELAKKEMAKYLLLQCPPQILQAQMALCTEYFTYLIQDWDSKEATGHME